MPETDITIQLYEPWMREQIIGLTVKEYPFMQGWFGKRFESLYESDYLKNRNQLVVAIEGKNKVVACISYVFWPLAYQGRLLSSYQMSGLLVADNMRGKGLFKKVLTTMDELLKQINPDVVFGFPVEASISGFVNQGWKHLFNLVWYAVPVSLTGLFSQKDFKGEGFEHGTPKVIPGDAYIQTAAIQEFWDLRENFFPDWPTYYKTYAVNSHHIQIIFRIQKIKGRNAAVIGRIYSGQAGVDDIGKALKLWLTDLRKNGTVLVALAAVNEYCTSNEQMALRKKLFRTSKQIMGIVKSYSDSYLDDPTNWNVMRGDMETW